MDEECRVPKGSDQAWVEKLYDKCKKYPQFAKPRLSNSAYIIAHFADRVQYQCEGFVEKNRDTVLEEQIHVLRNSSNAVVLQLVEEELSNLPPASGGGGGGGSSRNIAGTAPRGGIGGHNAKNSGTVMRSHRKTVGSQFRESLTLLMNTLNATTPHYIRCIKPNDSKESFSFDPRRAVQQLRACGVLETVRISAAGFPSRLTYEEFFTRYRVLFRSSGGVRNQRHLERAELRISCETVLRSLVVEDDKFKFGSTKILFRAGIVAYLEKRRTDKLRACGLLIQRMVRGWYFRNTYQKLRRAAICGQRFGRGYLARRRAHLLRQNRAAVTIQKHVRGFLQRRRYLMVRRSVLRLQTYARGCLARRNYLNMVRHAKAIIIQKCVRGFLARKAYERTMRGVVLLQCCWRRWLARRQYKALRAEARSIEHVKNLNKGLENKIISMQQRIEEMNKELLPLRHLQLEHNELRERCEAHKSLAVELKNANGRIGHFEKLVADLESRLQRESSEKMDVLHEREALERDSNELRARNEALLAELQAARESVETRQAEQEETMKRRIDQERSILAQEYDQERSAYQKLLQGYRELESRNEDVEEELEKLREELGRGVKPGSRHVRNPSNISTASNMSDKDQDEDGGYGSVRLSVRGGNSGRISASAGDAADNMALMLKLRQRLKIVEKVSNESNWFINLIFILNLIFNKG